MIFDPDNYTLTIRREIIDGETQYVGRVAEFPNLVAFEDSFEEAREILRDAITTLEEVAKEKGQFFPLPYATPDDEFSGRITLRLPKSLHAKMHHLAQREDVSVNQLLVTAIATYSGETDGLERAAKGAREAVLDTIKMAAIYVSSIIESKTTPPRTTKLDHLSTTSVLAGLQLPYREVCAHG